jgi:hypothetical protein
MAKKKTETVEDILDRIMEDIDLIREKCICNGDENYQPEEEEDDDYYEDSDSDSDDEDKE